MIKSSVKGNFIKKRFKRKNKSKDKRNNFMNPKFRKRKKHTQENSQKRLKS